MRNAIILLSGLVIGAYGSAGLCETGVGDFGDICSLGEFFDPLCPCGVGVVLADCDGRLLPVSIGPSKFAAHAGLRIGTINPGSPQAVPLETGGREEKALVKKMWAYLTQVFGSEELARVATVGEESRTSAERHRAAYLSGLVQRFEETVELREWVDSRFSVAERDRIFRTPYSELATDLEKEAFRKICLMYGNGIATRLGNEDDVSCN